MKSAVTISVVDQARGGPFVFWDDIPAACARAAELGFDAVELFAPSPDAIANVDLQGLLDQHNLSLAAVGTGGGWVVHRWHLCSTDADIRQKSRDFIKSIIDMGAPYGAPAIIGSMQGRWGDGIDKDTALGYLRDAMNELGAYAAEQGVPVIYEHLNRYETNLCNTVAQGVELLKSLDNDNVKLLADLFHMNIEETDVATGIRDGAGYIGHVHFVDSNRQAAGRGHTDFEPIAAALKEIGYDKYASAEAFAIPDSDEAARQTIESFRKYLA